jgi:hypothetical protein
VSGVKVAETDHPVTRAIGISMHTGWGACVVVAGSLGRPEIVANQVIEILGASERFCFHMAAEMERTAAEKWLAHMRKKAIANAKQALEPLISKEVSLCAIVAKGGDAGELDEIFASHPRIHAAEGCFYRDVLRDACPIPVQTVRPSSLDPSKVGKLAAPPWGRDQKLAALAAWTVMTDWRKAETGRS